MDNTAPANCDCSNWMTEAPDPSTGLMHVVHRQRYSFSTSFAARFTQTVWPLAKAALCVQGKKRDPYTVSGASGALEKPTPSAKSASNHTTIPWPVPARSTVHSDRKSVVKGKRVDLGG